MFSSLVTSDPGYGYGYEEKQATFQWRWWHVILVLAALFPYICIFVLFGMVAKLQHSNTNNNYYTQSTVSAQFQTTGSSITKGSVVSLSATGAIQAGGGTSIYKNIVDFVAKCPSYLSMDAIYSDAYLVSYAEKGSTSATLQVVQVGATPNKGVVVTSQPAPYALYEVTALQDGLFVGITQDSKEAQDTAYVVAGTVSSATFAVSLGAPLLYTTGQYSMNPAVTRLSDTAFALAYYSSDPPMLATRYGSVDPASLKVTLSPEFVYANNSHTMMYAGTVGMSASQYLLLYFDSYSETDLSPSGGSGPLNALVATTSGNLAAGTAQISFSNTTTLAGSALSYYFAAAQLDNDTAVVAYIDADNNYGIRCQAVQLAADIALASQAVVYGASWLVTSGRAATDLSGWIMDLDVSRVSDAGDFMVLYSDISNNGAMTATSGQLTASGDLIRASPDFVLNAGNSAVESVYSWGALASGITTTLGSQTAILTSLTDFNCATDAISTFSLMEVRPAPFGAVTSTTASIANNDKNVRSVTKAYEVASNAVGTAEVVLSGTVDVAASTAVLTPGMSYYCTSMGTVVSGNTYYGREGSSVSGSGEGSAYYYIDDVVSNTIVTLDSRIGVATASNTLLLSQK